jgi:hypothetical protein
MAGLIASAFGSDKGLLRGSLPSSEMMCADREKQDDRDRDANQPKQDRTHTFLSSSFPLEQQ